MESRYNVHLHYENKDHVPETQVYGRAIRDIQIIDFVLAVIVHRSDHRTFGEILGFHI